MPDTAIVCCGGGSVHRCARASLTPGALVIAADSGLLLADELGLRVDLLVGDMDSITTEQVAAAESGGARVERHPAEKDATDLELALDAALIADVQRVLVLGGGGGRSDHHLANVALLSAPKFGALEIEAILGNARFTVIHGGRGPRHICGAPGSLVTLLPYGGWACGIRTAGLLYALDGEDLPPGTSRGVSNVFAADRASVVLEEGTLLAVQPLEDPS
ncbi:MAG TPA: thiamine diphosphokinase [Acidimicrobiia bacterium]|nr:thiamine diphosphokinase [Acidimicrobiia bacterium]